MAGTHPSPASLPLLPPHFPPQFLLKPTPEPVPSYTYTSMRPRLGAGAQPSRQGGSLLPLETGCSRIMECELPLRQMGRSGGIVTPLTVKILCMSGPLSLGNVLKGSASLPHPTFKH